MNYLHTGARWLFRFRVYLRSLFTGFFIIILILIISSFAVNPLTIIFTYIIFYISFVIVIAEIYARMSYNRYLYEIGDKEIKIEHGIIWKKYTSIPYQRVQNIDIRRGIIARVFGFSSVDVETAGNSGFGSSHGQIRFKKRGIIFGRGYKSEGHLPAIGIKEAEKIREFIINKVKQKHRTKQGL